MTADYSTELAGQITAPWSVPNFTPMELSGLQQWIGNYLNDVNGRLGIHPVVDGIGVIHARLGMPIGISQYLDYKVQVPPSNPANSTVLLQPSRASTPLLILSPEMLDKISTHYRIQIT